jgi:Helix-turn-helix.
MNREKATLEKLRNKAYREAYVAEHIDTGVAFQIHALREKQKLSQADLAKLAAMHQSQISKLENPEDEDGVSLSTLQKVAAAFDVALVVRFVSFGELVAWEAKLSHEALAPEDYAHDPRFAAPPAPSKQPVKRATSFAWLSLVEPTARHAQAVEKRGEAPKSSLTTGACTTTGTSDLWLR